MKTLVVVVLSAALAVVAAAPPSSGASAGPPTPLVAVDQDSQASEAVSKRGAARLSAVSGNSIVDNTVSNGPSQQQQQQIQQQQPQAPVSYSIQQQQQPLQQQPLYAPHPYSFAAPVPPQQPYFQYQPAALPALPPLAMIHSKYQGAGKHHAIQYVPQPYFQVPQFMYIFPQPQAGQAHQQAAGQTEQTAHAQQQQPQQQPHYVMLLQAPAPAPGFQYYSHPQLTLQQQPQQLITYYAGPQQQQLHHQLQHQLQQQLPQQPARFYPEQQQQQQQQQQTTRFYPEQQQLVYQSPPELQGDIRDIPPPHFVPKQNNQNPVGLEAPAPPTPASLVGSYGARVQQQQQHPHAYKTIIKA